MTLYSAYVVRHWLSLCITTLLTVTVILMVSTQLLPWMAFRSEHQLSWPVLGIILLYHIPGIMLYAVPMGSLVASGMIVSQLNTESAIVAMRTTGVSIRQLLQPFVYLGLVMSLLSLAFSEYSVTPSNQRIATLKNQITDKHPPAGIQYSEFDDAGNPVVILNALAMQDNTLTDATIIHYTESKLSDIIRIDTAVFRDGTWQVISGLWHHLQNNQIIPLSHTEIPVSITNIPPDQLYIVPKKPETLSLKDLRLQINHKSRSGVFSRDDQFNWHAKLAMPFASLIFSLLGAVMLLNNKKPSMAILMGIAVIIIYYTLLSIAMGISLLGWVNPIIAAWLPNILLFLVGSIWLR